MDAQIQESGPSQEVNSEQPDSSLAKESLVINTTSTACFHWYKSIDYESLMM